MILNIHGLPVDLPGIEQADIDAIEANLQKNLASGSVKGRTAIAEAFRLAVDRCPDANASDLWHHIIYRAYLRFANGVNPSQSWVRTSGDAFESWLAMTYNPALQEHGLELTEILSHRSLSFAFTLRPPLRQRTPRTYRDDATLAANTNGCDLLELRPYGTCLAWPR
jgi:hypothetical protein